MPPVGPEQRSPSNERATLTGAGGVVVLGALGVLGWTTHWRELASLWPGSIPMAPSTAVALLIVGGALILETTAPSARRTTAVAILVLVFACAQLITFAAHLPPALDALFVPEAGWVGGAPTGRISPWTAFVLLLGGLSLLFLKVARRSRAFGAAAGSLALAVHLLGALVTLGYLFGAPLLYGGPIVPMAFPTAVAMGCLGLALAGLTPGDSAPFAALRGASARARLLRAFLPVAPMIVVGELLFAQVQGLNPALHAALTAVLSALLVAVVVSYAAHGVGQELEHAHAERERSRRDADRLAAIVQSSMDAVYAESLEGTIVAWNASAERLFGYSPGEALGRPASLLVPPGSEDESTEALERIGAGERVEHREVTRLRRDGSPVVVSLSESPLRDAEGRVVGISAIARDVSEQRRAEKALRESQEKLRALFESGVVGILFGDIYGGIQDANDELLRLSGYSRDDLRAGLTWSALTPPEFLPLDEASITEARERGSCAPYEKQYIRKDGRRVWVLVGYVLLEPDRERSVAFVLDIDSRKRAEEELRHSEERFARVFHTRMVAIGIAEMASGRLIDVNESCAEFFGYAREEMLGRTVFELGLWANPSDRDRLVAGLSAGASTSSGEVDFRRKSGEVRHALVSLEAVTLAGLAEPLDLVVIMDMTERKHLESQLLHAQKMEAVGRLAGGVAHDFNNALGVILGYAELLMRDAGGAQRSKLEQILKATQRAGGLTRQLLAFSRKEVVDPKVLDLNLLLADLEKMLGRLIGEDVDLVIVPGADLGQVKVDAGQLEQVVVNLCVNARDAMPDGGSLRIETANADLESDYAAHHPPMAAGRYVMLAVSDNGSGIEKDMLSKIFEPFFTTKEEGKGTGLGLAMVYGIVKQAGGYVWVYSEVGQGTTFKIYLPRVDEPRSALELPEPLVPSSGWETILVVEDDASLRALAREILEDDGYRVLEAAAGSDAVEMVRQLRQPIHLLLTDVVMPGLSGRALATSLMAEHPRLKVLYMSGYTDDVIAHRGVLESGAFLISKPFTAGALLRRVREALGEFAGAAEAP